MEQPDQKKAFIRKLAEYLVGDQAHKSILLEMGTSEAMQWAELRAATPLGGYPTIDEAEGLLTKFLA